MANQNVLFYRATKAKFNALTEKNPLAIYFVTDIPAIYVGDTLFAVGSEVTDEFAGLISPEYKAKIDDLIASGGNSSSDEIEAIWAELTNKVNATDVYTKAEIDSMISDIPTSEEFSQLQNSVTEMETKVETSTDSVAEMQEAISQKADATTVTELQTIVEQKADINNVYTKEEVDNLIIGLDPETEYVFSGGDI